MDLTDGERVLLDLRAHGAALALPVAALLVVVGLAGFAAARAGGGPSQGVLRLAVAAGAALTLAHLSLVHWLRWRADRFVLTDERIALRSGVWRRTGRDVPLARVDEVTFSQTLLQRVRGSGTLRVAAGDADAVVVRDLPDVEAVQREVYRAVDALGAPQRAGGDGGRGRR